MIAPYSTPTAVTCCSICPKNRLKTLVLELPVRIYYTATKKHAFARLRRSGTKNCQLKKFLYKDILCWQFKCRRLQTVFRCCIVYPYRQFKYQRLQTVFGAYRAASDSRRCANTVVPICGSPFLFYCSMLKKSYWFVSGSSPNIPSSRISSSIVFDTFPL